MKKTRKPTQEVYTRHELAERLHESADFMLAKSEELRNLGRPENVWMSWNSMNLAIVLEIGALCGAEYLPKELQENLNEN